MKKMTFILGSSIFIVACSPKSVKVVENPPKIEFPNEMVSNGFELYGQKCGSCHHLEPVRDFSRQEWDKILPRMAKMAKLEGDQESNINAYINWELSKN